MIISIISFIILIFIFSAISTIYENKRVQYKKRVKSQDQIEKERAIIEIIEKVINSNSKLLLEYTSSYGYSGCERTERIVQPIAIFSGKELKDKIPLEDGQWLENENYLFAYCELRQEKRYFRIDRINNIKTL